MMIRRLSLSSFLLVAILGGTGCANLGAVREFASSSAQLTGYKDVTQRYVTSADRQLANLPKEPRFDTTRNNLLEQKAATAKDKDTLLKLHGVTTGYMSALAGLAGEDVYSISENIDNVSGAITQSEQLNINADHVQAYTNIVKRVTDWMMTAQQARDVKRMVKQNGADMDKLLEAMQLATEAYGIVLKSERDSALAVEDYRQIQWAKQLPDDKNLTAGRREVVSSLLKRAFVAEKTAQDEALNAQQASAAGLKKVREAHAALLQNIDRLNAKDVKALLRKAASDLKSIRESIGEL